MSKAIKNRIKIENNKEILDALYKDYDTRSKEIENSGLRYNRIVGYVQTYLSAISSLAIYIYITQPQVFQKMQATQNNSLEVTLALIFLTVFLFFLYSVMMDSLYMLVVNGCRIGAIENLINKRIGKKVLVWDSEIIPFALSSKWLVVDGSLRPQPLVFLWTSLLYVLSIIILCGFSFTYGKSYFAYFFIFACFFGFFQLWQWVKLTMGSEIAFIKNNIFYISGIDEIQAFDTDLVKFMVAPLTLFLGVIPMFIFSFQAQTLLPNSGAIFGFFTLPSVFVGDFLIIPFVNRMIYSIFKSGKLICFDSRFVKISCVVSLFIFSVLVMSYLHFLWVSDDKFGFMDLKKGELTVAGWWHLFFSITETFLISLLAMTGIISGIKKDIALYATFERAWILVILFVALSMFDELVKIFWLSISGFDYFSIARLLLAIAFMLMLRILIKSARL